MAGGSPGAGVETDEATAPARRSYSIASRTVGCDYAGAKRGIIRR